MYYVFVYSSYVDFYRSVHFADVLVCFRSLDFNIFCYFLNVSVASLQKCSGKQFEVVNKSSNFGQ